MLKRLFLYLVVLLTSFTALSASRFSLIESRTGASFGPYTIYQGAKVRISGNLYELSLADDRISFIGQDGKVHGPYQPVEGRLMRVGGVMYTFSTQPISTKDNVQRVKAEPQTVKAAVAGPQDKPIAEFKPLPPKQEMIPIPAENARRSVAPLDLPALPDASSPLTIGLWVAPVDITPIKWKVDGFSGAESDLERSTVGVGAYYNAWTFEALYSISAEGGNVVPSGMGVSKSSIEEGNSKAIALGYKRPFLQEGNWSALAGVYARYRIDEIDLSVRSLSQGTVIGTNDVESYFSSYNTRESSLELTELLVRIDLELAYAQDSWGASAAALIYAFSDIDVSGDFPYSTGAFGLSAEHDTPIGFRAGVWLGRSEGWKAQAEFTLGSETEIRLGIMRSF